MPPKKAKLIPGQRTLTGAIASSSSSSSYTQGPTRTSQKRGEVECWRDFAERKWKERFSWLDVRADGIYCIFCREGTARPVSTSGSDVFLTRGYTGTRPDVLSRHEGSTQHSTCAVTYRESLQRRSVKRNINDIIRSSSCLTVDGEAFCDALRWLYFLMKREIPHTTNFVPLRELCIQLGNSSLAHLVLEGKNRTYTFEQSMQEMMEAIGFTIEKDLLQKLCASPFYSVVLDESTDLSTVKQLGLVVEYLDTQLGIPQTRYLKLVDLTPAVHATADVIVNAVTRYLETTASPPPGIAKIAGSTCDQLQ